MSKKQYRRIGKKKFGIFLVVYVLIILAICFYITSAKYSNVGKVTGGIPVATWNIKVNNEDLKTSNKFLLNNSKVNSETKTAENKIAPNSEGAFEVILDLSGTEVPIQYKIEIDTSSITQKGLDFHITGYSINDGEIKTIENNQILGEVLLKKIDGNKVPFTSDDNCKINIHWQWDQDIENPVFTDEKLEITVTATIQQKIGEKLDEKK